MIVQEVPLQQLKSEKDNLLKLLQSRNMDQVRTSYAMGAIQIIDWLMHTGDQPSTLI
jgi:hypothetical protein